MNTRNAAERLPRFGRELWEPYLADTLLRVFASCGISGQIGTFTRPFLDFTQASVCSHHLGFYVQTATGRSSIYYGSLHTLICSCSSNEEMEVWLQVRLDLGLTSPQAQWLAKGGSGLSSGNLQGITEDPADAGGSASFPDSPYKHRCALLTPHLATPGITPSAERCPLCVHAGVAAWGPIPQHEAGHL